MVEHHPDVPTRVPVRDQDVLHDDEAQIGEILLAPGLLLEHELELHEIGVEERQFWPQLLDMPKDFELFAGQ
jgi:hypothetical protein